MNKMDHWIVPTVCNIIRKATVDWLVNMGFYGYILRKTGKVEALLTAPMEIKGLIMRLQLF